MEGSEDDEKSLYWKGKEYISREENLYDRGRVVAYYDNIDICNSWVLLFPGTSGLSTGVLATFYGLILIYLFMGIDIISEIFMSSIEKITSKQEMLTILDESGQVKAKKKINFWNPTVANLTLMALGSSAPEILLAVIETVTTLGDCPGQLGPSTIVGSAAFNLLIISGLSILAVNKDNDTDADRCRETPDGVKKINDLGVFSITATWSIFAYVWMYLVLRDQNVEIWEAWVTLAFFFLLIGMAYGADRYNSGGVEPEADADHKIVVDYSAVEIYRELINEQRGEKAETPAQASRR